MKSKLALSMVALSGLWLVPTIATANNSQSEATQNKSASVRTVTGCLSAGDKAGEYTLKTNGGDTWEVESKTVKLGDHVGHTVKVTGKVWHAEMHGAKEKTKEAVDPDANEHGHLNVTAVSMVSESCKM